MQCAERIGADAIELPAGGAAGVGGCFARRRRAKDEVFNFFFFALWLLGALVGFAQSLKPFGISIGAPDAQQLEVRRADRVRRRTRLQPKLPQRLRKRHAAERGAAVATPSTTASASEGMPEKEEDADDEPSDDHADHDAIASGKRVNTLR